MYTLPDFPRDLRPRKQQLKLFGLKFCFSPNSLLTSLIARRAALPAGSGFTEENRAEQ